MLTRIPQRSGWRGRLPPLGAWVAALFVTLLAVLQTSVLPYFPILGVQPALVLVSAVVFASTHTGSQALIWGFGGGLLVDLFSAAPLGTNALLFTLIAFAVGTGGRGLDRTHPLFPILATALATAVYYPTLLLALQLQGFGVDWGSQVGARLLPAVAVNVLAAVVLYPFVRLLGRWTGPVPGPRFKGVE